MQFTLLSALALATGLTSAADHKVWVGWTAEKQSGLVFTPANTTAAQGDTVTFSFYPEDHSVVQGGFSSPCSPMDGGFYSGFHATSDGVANMTYTVTVNDTKPIWFYCSQGSHCQSGMVGSINAATTGQKTLSSYMAASKKASDNVTPKVAAGTGGELKMSSTSSSSSSSSSASGSAASSTPSGAGAGALTTTFGSLAAAAAVVGFLA